MTRGEKIAWIWVWCAMALVIVALPFAVWRYWDVPLAYLDTQICTGSNDPAAIAACERLLSNDHATTEARSNALRKLAEQADDGEQRKVAIERLTALIQLGTATAEDWNFRGLNYYWLGDYDKAAEDFREATRMNEAVGIYWANLGDALNEAGKHAAAIDVYTTALAKGADMSDVLGNRGWARYNLGAFKEALADLDQALSKNAEHTDNLNDRGLVQSALRDYPAAVSDFDAALKIDKDNVTFLTNRAMAHAAADNTAKAAQDVDRALAIDGNFRPARLEKAWQLLSASRPVEALAEIEKADRLGPPDLAFLEVRANTLLTQGLLAEVIADADRAIAINDQIDWPYLLRAQARHRAEEFEKAIADANVILERRPNHVDALIARALAELFLGRTEDAFADMDRLIKANPDLHYTYKMRSFMNGLLGRLDMAEADALRSLELTPELPNSLATMGWVRLERNAAGEAAQYCDKALAIKEIDFALRCRALARLELSQLDAASADADRALVLDGFSASSHYVAGRIELARGNPAGAKARFDKALMLRGHDRSLIYMYRGDAERARGDLEKARIDYLEAQKRDLGRYRSDLTDRLSALSHP